MGSRIALHHFPHRNFILARCVCLFWTQLHQFQLVTCRVFWSGIYSKCPLCCIWPHSQSLLHPHSQRHNSAIALGAQNLWGGLSRAGQNQRLPWCNCSLDYPVQLDAALKLSFLGGRGAVLDDSGGGSEGEANCLYSASFSEVGNELTFLFHLPLSPSDH